MSRHVVTPGSLFRLHDAQAGNNTQGFQLPTRAERVMRKLVIALLVALVSAAPAFANYFANPQIGISRNVGSAANPTPQQVHYDEKPVPQGQQGPESFEEFVLKAFGLSVTQHRDQAAATTGNEPER